MNIMKIQTSHAIHLEVKFNVLHSPAVEPEIFIQELTQGNCFLSSCDGSSKQYQMRDLKEESIEV